MITEHNMDILTMSQRRQISPQNKVHERLNPMTFHQQHELCQYTENRHDRQFEMLIALLLNTQLYYCDPTCTCTCNITSSHPQLNHHVSCSSLVQSHSGSIHQWSSMMSVNKLCPIIHMMKRCGISLACGVKRSAYIFTLLIGHGSGLGGVSLVRR